MTLTTFKVGKQEFVVLPRKQYEALTRAEQDRRDGDIARKGRARYVAGKMKTLSQAEVKKKLGI